MSYNLLFGPDQGWSLEPVATWLYTEGRRLRDAAALVEGVGAQLDAAGAHVDPLLAAALDHEEKRLPIQGRLVEAEKRIVAIVQALLDRQAAQLSISLPAAAAGDCLIIAKALVEADAGRSAVPPADLEGRIARAIYGYLTVAAPVDRLTLHNAAKPLPNRARRSVANAATVAARRRGHVA